MSSEYNKERLRSDWNANQLDFERYDAMLVSADELAYACRMGDPGNILKYYSILKQLYLNLRTVVSLAEISATTSKINNIENDVYLIAKIFNEKGKTLKGYMRVFKTLEEIHMELLDIRQAKNLGVSVSKYLTSEERMAGALR